MKLGELVAERFGDSISDGSEVPMGAAERFRNHFVHDVEVDEVFRCHLQSGSGIGNFSRIVP